MHEADIGIGGEVVARDIRTAGHRSLRETAVETSAPQARSWDWSADEFSAGDQRELEALRARCSALSAELAAVTTAADALERRERVLREVLQRLARASWRNRRGLISELREAGLLER